MAIDRDRARAALERRLSPLRDSRNPGARPPGGWIRAIREAIGMTTHDLAARMNVSQSTVTRLEQSERGGTIQLDTLHRAADALNCDVVYALVPRQPLDVMVGQQAGRVAAARLRRLGHTMALEQQALEDPDLRRNYEVLRNEAMRSPGLWRGSQEPS